MQNNKEFKLLKPVFIKVSDLLNRRDPYNVYVKILSVEIVVSEEGRLPIAKCVVADETGSANALFKGDDVKILKEGKVIAIRNGTIRYVKNHISLEIDMFGRITPEQVQIKQNKTNNISQAQTDKTFGRRGKPRGNRQQRGNRQYRGNRQNRGNRQQRGYRQQRGNREQRGNRQFRGNKEFRGNRQQNEGKRQRKYQEGQRRPIRDQPKRQFREPKQGEKPRQRITWTKVAAIEPGDDNLNLIVKVISAKEVGRNVRLVLGDHTGIVNAFMRGFEFLAKDKSVAIFKAEAVVVKQHIELQLSRQGGKVQPAKRQVQGQINMEVNVSAKEWVEQQ